MSGNGYTKDAPPRLSNGQKVIYAFVEDSEHGPVLVTGPNIPVGSLIDMTRQALTMFEANWRAALEKVIAEKQKPSVLVGVDGGKLA